MADDYLAGFFRDVLGVGIRDNKGRIEDIMITPDRFDELHRIVQRLETECRQSFNLLDSLVLLQSGIFQYCNDRYLHQDFEPFKKQVIKLLEYAVNFEYDLFES